MKALDATSSISWANATGDHACLFFEAMRTTPKLKFRKTHWHCADEQEALRLCDAIKLAAMPLSSQSPFMVCIVVQQDSDCGTTTNERRTERRPLAIRNIAAQTAQTTSEDERQRPSKVMRNKRRQWRATIPNMICHAKVRNGGVLSRSRLFQKVNSIINGEDELWGEDACRASAAHFDKNWSTSK